MKLRLLIISIIMSFAALTVAAGAQTTNETQDSLQKRVQAREAKIKETLSAAQEKRLKGRCKAAQTRIAAAQKIATKHYADQDKRIDALITKLTEFAQKQKRNGADTSKLDSALADVSKDGQAVKTAYESYISALDDSAAIDCQTDPAGFKASLVDARSQFQTLKSARQDLRKVLREELVPALKDFKPKAGA